MSYIKAIDVLPQDIIELIQRYVDGEYIYIPRKESQRRSWGQKTNIKEIIEKRNYEIYQQYLSGIPVQMLSEIYYLAPKSIQKIIAKTKNKDVTEDRK